MRRLIIAASAVVGFVFAVEVLGHGVVHDYGTPVYKGYTYSCVPGHSVTVLFYMWERTETHGPPGPYEEEGEDDLPPSGKPVPTNDHQYKKKYSTTKRVPYGGYGYMSDCTVRVTKCETKTEWTKVAQCTDEEIDDGNDDTCPEATYEYDWIQTYSHSTWETRYVGGDAYQHEIRHYDIEHGKEVKKDPNCRVGAIIP